ESEVGVLVYNTGGETESYHLEVIGSVSSWAFVEPSTVQLGSGESRTVRLVLRPPRTGDVPAGPMPFVVRLHARGDPGPEEVAEGTVDLVAFESFTARLMPDVLEVGSRARTRVAITNDGNIPIVVRLSTSSPDDALTLKLEDETVLVPAATSASVSVAIKPRHRRLIGRGEPALYSVRLESLLRVASLAGRAQPKGSLPSLLLRGALAGMMVGGLVLGGRWVLAAQDDGPQLSKKGLPKVIRATTIPVEPLAGGLTGVEEAPPVSAVANPGPAATPLGPPGAGGTIAPRPPDATGPATALPLRRLFDPALSDYVYTTDPNEAGSLVAAGMVDQGVAGKILTAKAPGTVALYRLKKSDRRHVFTFDEAERRALVGKGAVTERTAGYLYPSPAKGTTPLHRMSKDGAAYLTTDNGDVQSRLANGWVNEGIRGYVLV
ncbi:MAG: hypothetical protein WKF86_08925, partial [Acidimicrobiales bacterium]